MKKILSIILILLLLCGCTENKESNESTETIKENKEMEFSNEKIELDNDDYRISLFSKLNEYGTKIYEEKIYEKYPKVNEAYFVSLTNLEVLGYDISIFKGPDGTKCDTNKSGIYFDIEYKIVEKVDANQYPIVPTLIGCTKEEIK